MVKPVYLYVTPFFPSPTDWTGSFCLDYVRALIKTDKYEVHVFRPGLEDYEIAGIKVHSFRVRALPSAILPFFYERANKKSFLAAVDRAGIDINRVAVCHGHTATFTSYVLAVKTINQKCKTLLHHHDPKSFGLGSGILQHVWIYNLFVFLQMRSRFERVDCHVFVSEMVKKSFLDAPHTKWTDYAQYKRQMKGIPWRGARIKSGIVLHNGVDTNIFYSKARQVNTRYTIGYVANFVDWKDPLNVIKAVESVRAKGYDVRLRMLGSDSTQGRIRKLLGSVGLKARCCKYVKEHGLDSVVEFCREVPHEDLPKFFRSLDLFVLPSYFEGFGCVFTEAYACGVPFICCRGQGISELAPERWQVEPRDVEMLSEKIVEFIKDTNRIRSLKLSQEYRINRLVEDFVCQIKD